MKYDRFETGTFDEMRHFRLCCLVPSVHNENIIRYDGCDCLLLGWNRRGKRQTFTERIYFSA